MTSGQIDRARDAMVKALNEFGWGITGKRLFLFDDEFRKAVATATEYNKDRNRS